MSEKPKYAKLIEGMDHLSLGISMVVAIGMGIGLGFLMRDWFGVSWLLWVGVFWGVGGAAMNVYKVYKKNVKSFENLSEEEKTCCNKNDRKVHDCC